jgi:hypothetical protein
MGETASKAAKRRAAVAVIRKYTDRIRIRREFRSPRVSATKPGCGILRYAETRVVVDLCMANSHFKVNVAFCTAHDA